MCMTFGCNPPINLRYLLSQLELSHFGAQLLPMHIDTWYHLMNEITPTSFWYFVGVFSTSENVHDFLL